MAVPTVSWLRLLRAGGAPAFHLYVSERHAELGPLFRQHLSPSTSALFLSHPAEMRRLFACEGKFPHHFLPPSWILYNRIFECKRGLFFMEGEEWYKYRRIMNKHLLRKDTASELAHVHSHTVDTLLTKWGRWAGQELPALQHQLYRHSISWVMGTLMGSSYVEAGERFEGSVERLSSVFSQVFTTTASLDSLPVRLASALRLPPWNDFVRALSSSLAASKEVVGEMMAARSGDGLLQNLLDEGLDPATVEILVTDLMLAAGDTTAYTSQWALYLVAREGAEFQERLLEAASSSSSPVRGVMKEALRLYPAAPFISRRLPAPHRILGHTLQQGEMVMLSMYSSGRDEGNYPSAERFWPERWERREGGEEGGGGGGLAGVTHPSAFLPFALGARACVGAKVAQEQITSTVFNVVKKFRLELLEEVGMVLRPVPVPDRPVRIRITPRAGS